MAIIALDDLSSRLLVGTYHLTQVFGVELRREMCRAHQIAEHYRELAAFRLGRTLDGNRWKFIGQSVVWDSRCQYALFTVR
jgi:hypothetical protein